MTKDYKYPDVIYEEIFDGELKRVLMKLFRDDLSKTHVVTEAVYLPSTNRWIIKIEKDHVKAMMADDE